MGEFRDRRKEKKMGRMIRRKWNRGKERGRQRNRRERSESD